LAAGDAHAWDHLEAIRAVFGAWFEGPLSSVAVYLFEWEDLFPSRHILDGVNGRLRLPMPRFTRERVPLSAMDPTRLVRACKRAVRALASVGFHATRCDGCAGACACIDGEGCRAGWCDAGEFYLAQQVCRARAPSPPSAPPHGGCVACVRLVQAGLLRHHELLLSSRQIDQSTLSWVEDVIALKLEGPPVLRPAYPAWPYMPRPECDTRTTPAAVFAPRATRCHAGSDRYLFGGNHRFQRFCRCTGVGSELADYAASDLASTGWPEPVRVFQPPSGSRGPIALPRLHF
jgi:hypothetical protein